MDCLHILIEQLAVSILFHSVSDYTRIHITYDAGAGERAQTVKCLPHKNQELSPDPQLPHQRKGTVVHRCASEPQHWGGKDRWVSGIGCPTNLATRANTTFSGRACLKENKVTGWRGGSAVKDTCFP